MMKALYLCLTRLAPQGERVKVKGKRSWGAGHAPLCVPEPEFEDEDDDEDER